MITPAIFNILNDAPLNTKVKNIYAVQAPEGAEFPLIIINEKSQPELFKRGADVMHYDLQIDIYSERDEYGSTRLRDLKEIEDLVLDKLTYFSGFVQDTSIDTIILENKELMFDTVAQKQRVMIEFRVRVNGSNLAPPPIVCPAATVLNSDSSYNTTVASGGTLILPDTEYIFVVDGVPQTPLFLPTLKNETINIVWQ